ncbi:MAG: hypothetical protein Q3986_07435 [Akkermansia sp.]|nr:hypothetical protein [Akkermansia sp.]
MNDTLKIESKDDRTLVHIIALATAREINEQLTGYGNSHEDEIVQVCMERAYTLYFKFRPGGGSLRGYLNTYMRYFVKDVKRKFLPRLQEAQDVLDEMQELPEVAGVDASPATLEIIEDVRRVFKTLSPDEQALASFLVTCKPADAERNLGWSHGRTMRTLERLRKKFEEVHAKRTFSAK